MFKLYAILIVVGLLGGAVYGAKYYYDTTQNTIASLRENNAKLEVANETNQATIKKMGQDTARLNDLTNQLAQDLQTSERYGDELRSTLNKHNLTNLANKKPGLIEKRMQNATDKLWDDLEGITSSDSNSTAE
jgi:predicted nuclease with TOPRIM domain|tara:strand:+ start:5076 stop:5474 length:399 start_codon:yes stop_codon:yes gene_type:complete